MKKKAYGIGFVEKIKDLPLYMKWAGLSAVALKKGGGKQLARNGTFQFKALDGALIPKAGRMKLVEGDYDLPARMAVVEFASYEKALAWYNSPAANKIRPMREKAATAWTLVVEAVIPPTASTKRAAAKKSTTKKR